MQQQQVAAEGYLLVGEPDRLRGVPYVLTVTAACLSPQCVRQCVYAVVSVACVFPAMQQQRVAAEGYLLVGEPDWLRGVPHVLTVTAACLSPQCATACTRWSVCLCVPRRAAAAGGSWRVPTCRWARSTARRSSCSPRTSSCPASCASRTSIPTGRRPSSSTWVARHPSPYHLLQCSPQFSRTQITAGPQMQISSRNFRYEYVAHFACLPGVSICCCLK